MREKGDITTRIASMSKDIEYIRRSQDDLKSSVESLERSISGKFRESFTRINKLESAQDKFIGAAKIIGFVIAAAITIITAWIVV